MYYSLYIYSLFVTTREYNPVRRTFYDVNYVYFSGYVTKLL